MSHVCAKPTCAESARVWFDFAPAEMRVIERTERGDASVGLCETHGQRFGVPQGWSFERLNGGTDATQAHTPEAELTPPLAESNRAYSRERPWFLALSDTPTDAVSNTQNELAEDDASGAIDQSGFDDEFSAAQTPSAGSLLHRAFHGPDRKSDAHRAAHDELERRRAARADDDACGTIALPFPPFGPGHQVAVS